MNKKPMIRIDVVSNVVCRWCYIGKRRLEKAIEGTQSSDNVQVKEVEIVSHPFQIAPFVSTDGISFQTYLENRFGSNFV